MDGWFPTWIGGCGCRPSSHRILVNITDVYRIVNFRGSYLHSWVYIHQSRAFLRSSLHHFNGKDIQPSQHKHTNHIALQARITLLTRHRRESIVSETQRCWPLGTNRKRSSSHFSLPANAASFEDFPGCLCSQIQTPSPQFDEETSNGIW